MHSFKRGYVRFFKRLHCDGYGLLEILSNKWAAHREDNKLINFYSFFINSIHAAIASWK